MFAVPALKKAEANDIQDLFQRNFAAGLNVYAVPILSLAYHTLVLLKEQWRIRVVREVCHELDARQEQAARTAWHDLLAGLN